MGRKAVKDYAEPWVATKSRGWESGFRHQPEISDYIDGDDVLRWLAAKDKAEAEADWIIWGSRLAAPAVVESLSGVVSVMGDRMILATARRPATEAKIDQEIVARRIVECVNACAGIADPVETIPRIRQLLLEMVRGETDSRDDRVLAALARVIPADQIEEFADETSRAS